MKIITVVGARPQFVKASVLSRIIDLRDDIEEVIIHTGQHYDANMSDIFFEELGIRRPNYYLGISGIGHAEMTAQMMIEIEKVILEETPDLMLLYGDTNSTLAGALVASKLGLDIAHVEAGLRSWNKAMPEEINRIITDQVAKYLFVPSESARMNLIKENINPDFIFNVGDIMYDATKYYSNVKHKMSPEVATIVSNSDEFLLLTLHRQSNTDSKETLKSIMSALYELSKNYLIVFPVHPRTKSRLNSFDLSVPANVKIIEPCGYLDMLELEKASKLVITDSGGVQKEAYFNNKKCITLRKETEWVELVEARWNTLVDPTNIGDLNRIVLNLLSSEEPRVNVYGDGSTAESILNILL